MMSIISLLFSKFPFCFRRKPIVHVCGLLGTHITGVDGPREEDDYWMAIDFVALHHLIGAREEHSKWLCGTPIRTDRDFLLGDPACDRIFFDPPPFETVYSGQPSHLAIKYLLAVKEASSLLSNGDTLVLVLVGHGNEEDRQSFVIGNEQDHFKLTKKLLEECVLGTKGNILLISTACFSGSWKSPYWTLLAAAKEADEAPSMVASGSKEYRGGFFTTALLAEYADKFKIRPPYPGLVDETGQRAPQKEHDFGPLKIINPSPCFPKRSFQGVLDWIHRFRDDIGRTYTSTDIIFHPCSNEPHDLPFCSLISAKEPFYRLECVPPSLPDDASSSHSATHYPAIPSAPLPQITEPSVTWSASDEAELVALAADFLLYMPLSITSERGPILGCMNVKYGPSRDCVPFNPVMKRKLLYQLKKRECHRELALAIAKNLGWEKAVQDIGGPGGKQRQMATRVDLRCQAEASGCLVSVLLIVEGEIPHKKQWAGAAGWLARIWEARCHYIYLDINGNIYLQIILEDRSLRVH